MEASAAILAAGHQEPSDKQTIMIQKNLSMIAGCLLFCFAFPVPAQQFGGGGGAGRRAGGGGLGGGGGVGSGSTGRTYFSNGQVGEAMVTSDPETRRLIVITDEETSKYVGQVITNLDQPKPQVLINVVFLEVTYANNFDFGIESAYKPSSAFSATNSFGNLAAQGAANSWGIPGQGLYQLSGKEFNVVLRAIAENGKLEVISRPTILARNNQQANIMVGQQVPLISNVRFDTIGNQINTVTYQDVGIILRVTPFITSDDLVEMIVAPEISALDRSQSIPISTGVVAPVINKRAADTVVVTPDKQTVVIGGLMENDKNQSVSKVPWLGDIPGIGWLFRRTTKGGTKTELMIFLTPHIVRNAQDLRTVSDYEQDKAIYAPNAFSEEELNRFLNSLPLKRGPTPDDKKSRFKY
jgi:general secretion pathway protein D